MSSQRVRGAAVLAAALAVIAVIAAATAIPVGDDSNPSSRSAGSLGTLALYTWLSRLGLPVTRISGTFTLSGDDVVVCYAPTVALSTSDVDAVMRHLRSGGDLVLALDPSSEAAAAPLLDRLGIATAATMAAGTATVAEPFDASDRVHAVPVSAGFSFVDAAPLVPILVEEQRVVAGIVRIKGGGRAYLIGDTGPLSNDGLRRGDAPFLALSMLQRARGGHVAFDEFHHGEGATASGAAAIFSGPFGLSVLLIAVIVIAAFVVNGRRLGRPAVDDATVAVPSTTTYVTAMAGMVSRSRDRGTVAARYAGELKRRIGSATGIDPHLDDRAFAAALIAMAPERAGDVVDLIDRARRLAHGTSPSERTLLRLARDVDRVEREWFAVAAP